MAGENTTKTREDVEALKRDWQYDSSWDIYDTEGFEEYREELTTFQRDYEANIAKRRQEERAKLASLVCPMVPHGACQCYLEKCAWWCDWKDMCAIKLATLRLEDIAVAVKSNSSY